MFGLNFVMCILIEGRWVFFCYIGTTIATTMHQDLLSRVTKAPVNLFFDVTPMGKLMSNFTSDINKTNSRFFGPVNWVFTSVSEVLIKIGFALYFSPFMIFAIAINLYCLNWI